MAAKELAPKIRVNAICPGLVLPPDDKINFFNDMIKSIPLKKAGNIDNITKALSFLINNDFVTGQILYIDGGQHLV